jgi:hypothetical protein
MMMIRISSTHGWQDSFPAGDWLQIFLITASRSFTSHTAHLRLPSEALIHQSGGGGAAVRIATILLLLLLLIMLLVHQQSVAADL